MKEVWNETSHASLQTPVSCRILALRACEDHPVLVSTSRHVTQGMVDVESEAWDAAMRKDRAFRKSAFQGCHHLQAESLPPAFRSAGQGRDQGSAQGKGCQLPAVHSLHKRYVTRANNVRSHKVPVRVHWLQSAYMRSIILFFMLAAGIANLAAQEISPFLFGQNHWMAQSDEGKRPGYLHLLWPKVGESGVRLVRIGGAGYESRFPNRQRLTAMIAAIRGIGAEPLLQVPRHFSAEQAAELVRDLNASPSGKVKFWSIGNEPLMRDRDGVDKVYQYITRIAPALKAVDPTLKILVFDECELRTAAYEALCGGRLDVTGKDASGAWMIDGFTFHRYPNGREFDREDVLLRSAEDIRRQARSLVAMMKKADRKHGRTGDARLCWGLTEVNVTYANPDRKIDGFGNASFLGGQFMAEVFGIGMELGAFTVAPWCINETDRVQTDFGYLGLPPDFHPRSSYYHIQMMARHMTGQFVRSSTSEPQVKSIATRTSDGFAVMVLNQSLDRDFDYEIVLSQEAASTKSLVVAVEAGLSARHEGRLANQTTVLLLFDPRGRPTLQYTYGLGHNQENLPPEKSAPR